MTVAAVDLVFVASMSFFLLERKCPCKAQISNYSNSLHYETVSKKSDVCEAASGIAAVVFIRTYVSFLVRVNDTLEVARTQRSVRYVLEIKYSTFPTLPGLL